MRFVAAFAVLAACATTPPPRPSAVGYPGTLVDPAKIQPDFMLRQKLTARHGDEEVAFEAVLQKRGNTLTLLGLAPWGGKAFAIEQTGSEVAFHRFVPRELPFEPKYMLLDIDRAYFLGISETPLADGEHALERDGERVTETWKDGHLASRRFSRLSGDPAGEIAVTYDGWTDGRPFPQHLDFDNGWFHYRLSIDTLSWQPL